MKAIRSIWQRTKLDQLAPAARKVLIAVIGTTILLIGLALIILPGPAFIVIPVGLAILASEFVWARKVIRRGRILVRKVKDNLIEKTE